MKHSHTQSQTQTDKDILDELGLSELTGSGYETPEQAIDSIQAEELESQLSAEDNEALDAQMQHPIFSVLPKTKSTQKSIRRQLQQAKMSQGLMDTLVLMQAEDIMSQLKEQRASVEYERREQIRTENKFKELRYRKALEQGIADDAIRLEFARQEKVVHEVSAETQELFELRRERYEAQKRIKQLESKLENQLKG